MRLSHFPRMAAGGMITALTIAGVGALTATPAYAAMAEVSAVHGIPNTPVDVYVNGEKTLENFAPGAVAGPMNLEEGAYDIALTKPGEPLANAILKVDDKDVLGGTNISIVAHLDANAQPKITSFANDTSKVDAGKARLIARHTAAAPAVDMRADGTPLFESLTHSAEAKADVIAGTVMADAVLAGTGTVVIGPADLELAEGTATILYAIGSADAGNLQAVAQTITGLHSAPAGVPSGDGGLAGTGAHTWWYLLAGAGILLLIGGGTRVATDRVYRR
ncbi:DUF4397 domain-containing protein [Salinispora arenicola]|uniref:Lipoprotein n=1 Tax=Salinispora arenicola TaxID=168697 RepID=A0A542XLE1_SALAC|nr:DUF4397 domain-containing protein [Salinispora arenicola]TQL36672.1 uncharacterized protein DUF4397 [Salinispora arenicola]GIM87570.1 lipoprotein [Salinispora arenicola]